MTETQQTLATWRLDNAAIDRGTFCLLDTDRPGMWISCEQPVSVRHFTGL
ncbi:hypothetical protein ACFR9U_00425 [Halorientalis brevis]|uniref:Uncharacterized protein n=1 Tax=Halorientalis brevis TaxID=1126241 RepID=A0ABD6C7N5_9EURY|nr:hypothetical protein [Halorientalis brevis]